MAVVVVADGQLYPLDFAVEHGRFRIRPGQHGGAQLTPDLNAFGRRKDHRLRDQDFTLARFLPVVIQRDVAAFGKTSAGVSKLERAAGVRQEPPAVQHR